MMMEVNFLGCLKGLHFPRRCSRCGKQGFDTTTKFKHHKEFTVRQRSHLLLFPMWPFIPCDELRKHWAGRFSSRVGGGLCLCKPPVNVPSCPAGKAVLPFCPQSYFLGTWPKGCWREGVVVLACRLLRWPHFQRQWRPPPQPIISRAWLGWDYFFWSKRDWEEVSRWQNGLCLCCKLVWFYDNW